MAIAYLFLLFAVLAWGGSFVAARLVLSPPDGGPALGPLQLAALRFGAAGLVFLPLLARRLRAEHLPLRTWLALALVGQLGISAYFWLQYTGVRLTSAGVAALLVVGLIPAATAALGWATGSEALGRRRLAGLGLGFLGVALVGTPRGLGGSVGPGYLAGVACLVANAFCFAAYTTASKRLVAGLSSLTTTAGVLLAGAVPLAIAATLEGWGDLAGLSGTQWASILYLALVCSVGAYFAYTVALSRLEATRAAAWVYLEPLVAFALGWAMLGEALTPPILAGAAAIAAGVALLTREPLSR
jgi:drug/metabolite transporter (DMT)-like permease